MNLDPSNEHSLGDYVPSSGGQGSYEPSVTPSTASSQTSVFSDTFSASSSIATSISDDFRNTLDDALERDRVCAQAQSLHQGKEQTVPAGPVDGFQQPSYADVTSVPAQERSHPRRSSSSRSQKPPPLVRQRDRKVNFVDNLVDSATQMVEVIWPLSVVPCANEGGARGVLPLRTYIEETLRRSRTSYSTLQVALYYLLLMRPHVPKSDFTMEQPVDCPAERALMCGRRMFLAALILASKYLQDRNYSAKAWSKMSGLRICEINANERIFLSKVNWRLHIPKPTFETWQEIVLRYSPNPPPSPGSGLPSANSSWKRMVPLLSPELDNMPFIESIIAPDLEHVAGVELSSPATPTPSKQTPKPIRLASTSQESTPTPSDALPRFLEPRPDLAPRMGPLPTPNLTPSSVASDTPAASLCGFRRPSMSSAMALAHKGSMNRCAMDYASYAPPNIDMRFPLTRRPSTMSIDSFGSSPESMMTDNSRSSRSSSVSSISTVSSNSSIAPPRACLARQATCRNAGLLPPWLAREEKEGTMTKPIIIEDDAEMVSSPIMADFSVREKALHAPHRHSRATKPAYQATSSAPAEKNSRKRGRCHGNRRSELQEEVRYLLEESLEDVMELDDDDVSPTPAASCASNMRAHHDHFTLIKEAQPSALLCRRESSRVPVQKRDGSKRTCCSSDGVMSVSPVALYGEVGHL